MKGLNQRQREFLVEISGRVVVYLLTIAIVGQFLNRDFDPYSILTIILSATILLIFALFLLKKGDGT